MPQLDPASFSPQIVWLAVAFVVLYLALSRTVLPRIAEVLALREARVKGDLGEAEELKARAETALAAYEKALKDARAEAQGLVRRAAADGAAESKRREAAFAAVLAEKTGTAERRIAAAKAAALADMQGVAAEAAASIAAKLAGIEVGAAEAKAALTGER